MIIISAKRIEAVKRSVLVEKYSITLEQATALKNGSEIDVEDETGQRLIEDGYAYFQTMSDLPFFSDGHKTEEEE